MLLNIYVIWNNLKYFIVKKLPLLAKLDHYISTDDNFVSIDDKYKINLNCINN